MLEGRSSWQGDWLSDGFRFTKKLFKRTVSPKYLAFANQFKSIAITAFWVFPIIMIKEWDCSRPYKDKLGAFIKHNRETERQVLEALAKSIDHSVLQRLVEALHKTLVVFIEVLGSHLAWGKQKWSWIFPRFIGQTWFSEQMDYKQEPMDNQRHK